jgi:pilus assembly protein CpaF
LFGQLDGQPATMTSVIGRPDAVSGGASVRSLDEIFPLRGDVNRARQMQETWRGFGAEMGGAVRSALGAGRSPPEIAYAIGEIVHNYFRTRGVTLTSYELRRLVAELLAEQDRRRPSTHCEGPLVSFGAEPASRGTSWTGAEAVAPAGPAVSDAVFEGPPSKLVTVAPRDADEALLADLTAKVRARLAGDPHGLAREVVIGAIDAVLGDVLRAEPQRRRGLVRLALSELCGLGPLDRLWADRSIRAVFVNGPHWIHVERNGVLEPSPERFRDQAQLEETVGRLVRPPAAASGVAWFRLRDGGEGVVLFPPAAPDGPILALRRGDPGDATFERLITAGRLDRPMADLLRLATRSRLNVLVVGPEASGKTALLAAMARDLGDARVVTVARHREFRWPSASKVELTISPQASLASLLAAGAHLRPDLVVIDSVVPADAPSLAAVLSRGLRGIVAAGASSVLASAPREAVDLVVRLGPGGGGLFVVVSIEDASGAQVFAHEDGGFHRRTSVPSFAGAVQRAGYGEALSSVLR